MKRKLLTIAATLPLLMSTACGGGEVDNNAAATLPLAPDCTAIQHVALPNTVIKSTLYVGADAVRSGTTSMPAHCVVTGEINPRTGVNGVRYGIGFELRLPLEWNRRFQFQGGGGVDGSIGQAYGTLRTGVVPALAQGSAVVTSDMGHTGTSTRDARFGLDPQARIDWGYASMDRVTIIAKDLIKKFYGANPTYSYYVGSSGGGRQGMIMAQRFPLHFDGIVSGAPILEQHIAQISSMQMLQRFTAIAPKDIDGNPILSRSFSDADLKLITDGVLAKCDALDGAADGIIENYAACTYDVAPLQCAGPKTAACLSPEQVSAFSAVMAGPRDSKGKLLYVGAPWDTGIGEPEWRSDMIGTSTSPIPNSRKSTNESVKYVFMTPAAPDFDYLKFDFDVDPLSMAASAWFTAANATDYAGFKARNGKQIVYVGISDYLNNANGVNRWYRELTEANGGIEATKQSVRFFNVPGMAHSSGGRSLDQFDPVTAIQNWVEKGIAPEFMLAKGAKFPGRERPICAYPNIAMYVGSGSFDSPDSFRCSPVR